MRAAVDHNERAVLYYSIDNFHRVQRISPNQSQLSVHKNLGLYLFCKKIMIIINKKIPNFYIAMISIFVV
jgi:hypothetical protein